MVEDVGELSQPQTEVHSRNGFEGESNLFRYSKISINSSPEKFQVKIFVFRLVWELNEKRKASKKLDKNDQE